MHAILTSKPGQFRPEPAGTTKARCVTAGPERMTKIRSTEELKPPLPNLVPAKFLPSHGGKQAARRELDHPAAFGSVHVALRRMPVPADA